MVQRVDPRPGRRPVPPRTIRNSAHRVFSSLWHRRSGNYSAGERAISISRSVRSLRRQQKKSDRQAEDRKVRRL